MFSLIENGTSRLDITMSDRMKAEEMKIALDELVSSSGYIELADKSRMKKASELEGALIPGLEIRAFDRNQRAEAEAWLSSKDA